MNYKQIGEILNDVYGSIIGEGELIKEDLSNIVEVGKVITSSSTFDDNFDTLVKKLVDKVGKTIEHTDTLEVRHLPIYRDSCLTCSYILYNSKNICLLYYHSCVLSLLISFSIST